MRNLTSIIIFIISLTGVFLASCNNEQNVDCFQCVTHKPDSAYLIIYSTINNENPKVLINIYKAKYDINSPPAIAFIDTLKLSTQRIKVPVGYFYSVKALYKVGTDTVAAIDGDNLSITKVNAACDSVCWTINGGQINVRLKYTKVKN
jgi:hypothetical protein